ncbi:MAG: DUF1697 domain-containing protein [Ignavibacteriales bacterium]|nr:MAG: DUF1697 domain-containing protein [Ignavibacteriales bacterium]
MKSSKSYMAFLRGINVGGHHKLPMAGLRAELAKLGASDVKTLLNSGNALFTHPESKTDKLEKQIEQHLAGVFGFPVPVMLRESSDIYRMAEMNPFEKIKVTKDIRLYVTLIRKSPPAPLKLPRVSSDGSFKILMTDNRCVFSVLDLAVTKTPKGMDELERIFGKDVTTRNWNTIVKMRELFSG